MPTYAAGAMADEDAWSVVHYIRTLFPPAVQARQTQKTASKRSRRSAA